MQIPFQLKKITSALLILGSTFFMNIGQTVDAQTPELESPGEAKDNFNAYPETTWLKSSYEEPGVRGELVGLTFRGGWKRPARFVLRQGRVLPDSVAVSPEITAYVAKRDFPTYAQSVRWDVLREGEGIFTVRLAGGSFGDMAAGLPERGVSYGVAFREVTPVQKDYLMRYVEGRAPGEIYHVEPGTAGTGVRLFMSGRAVHTLRNLDLVRGLPAEIMVFRHDFLARKGGFDFVDLEGMKSIWQAENRGEVLKVGRIGKGAFWTLVSPRYVMATREGLKTQGFKPRLTWEERETVGTIAEPRARLPVLAWGYKGNGARFRRVIEDFDRGFGPLGGGVAMTVLVDRKFAYMFREIQKKQGLSQLMISSGRQGQVAVTADKKTLETVATHLKGQGVLVRRVEARPKVQQDGAPRIFKVSKEDFEGGAQKASFQKREGMTKTSEKSFDDKERFSKEEKEDRREIRKIRFK